jgi:hypothetical protein
MSVRTPNLAEALTSCELEDRGLIPDSVDYFQADCRTHSASYSKRIGDYFAEQKEGPVYESTTLARLVLLLKM